MPKRVTDISYCPHCLAEGKYNRVYLSYTRRYGKVVQRFLACEGGHEWIESEEDI